VRRADNHEVRLLANHLVFVQPGELLAAAAGVSAWPHRVFELYWPQADAESFAPLPQA
jgi:hypothetical protein